MKPEYANLFTFNTTGVDNDIVASFFYEWQHSKDGTNMELEKKQVASIVLSLDDALKLIDMLNEFKQRLKDGGVMVG